MKISYRTHPALEYLKKGNIEAMKIQKVDLPFFIKEGDFFINIFNTTIPDFSKEITYVSIPFFEAVERSSNKFIGLLMDFDLNGTYILGQFIFFSKLVYIKNISKTFALCFVFRKDGVPVSLYYQNPLNDSLFFWHSEAINFQFTKEGEYEACRMGLNTLGLIENFKKYAEVETKYLSPNKRVKDINCKYVNDTSLGITHLDSRWFTNLVKSDAFKVRGHFRLQPKKKDGEWTKELIWITDFEKKGYTSKARKLSLEGTSQPTTDNR